jgi:hypothetical protein
MNKRCGADYGHFGKLCRKKASTRRRVWRFGRGKEPAIVHEWLYLCPKDANIYDDIQEEGRAEAAGS